MPKTNRPIDFPKRSSKTLDYSLVYIILRNAGCNWPNKREDALIPIGEEHRFPAVAVAIIGGGLLKGILFMAQMDAQFHFRS